MIHHHEMAVTCARLDSDHDSIGCHMDWAAVGNGDVHALVEFAFTAERVKPLAEACSDLSSDGPKRRSKRGIAKPRLGRQKVQTLLHHCQRGCVLLKEIELVHGTSESVLRVAGKTSQCKRSFAEAHKTVGHGDFRGKRLQRIED